MALRLRWEPLGEWLKDRDMESLAAKGTDPGEVRRIASRADYPVGNRRRSEARIMSISESFYR